MTSKSNSKSDEYESESIIEYLRLQASGEKVERLEKVTTRSVGSREYDIWDVKTDQNHWWVITPLTNLYDKSAFPELHLALTTHIGIVEQLRARDYPSADEESALRAEKTQRLWSQALEAHNSAKEATDFQTVGVRLRETLLSLVQDVRSAKWTREVDPQPKSGDFDAWLVAIIGRVLAGSENARLRKHVQSNGKSAWQLVNWLTHYKNASMFDSEIALASVDNISTILLFSVVRYERGAPRRCPDCESYRINSYYLPDDGNYRYVTICEVCQWEDDIAGIE